MTTKAHTWGFSLYIYALGDNAVTTLTGFRELCDCVSAARETLRRLSPHERRHLYDARGNNENHFDFICSDGREVMVSADRLDGSKPTNETDASIIGYVEEEAA